MSLSQETKGICIPTLLIDISEDDLYMILNKYNLGRIDKIYIQKNKQHLGTNTGFVWFSKWNLTETSIKILNTLKEGKSIQLLYDFPKFIQCYQIKNERFKDGFKVEKEKEKKGYQKRWNNNVSAISINKIHRYRNSHSWDLHIGRSDKDNVWRKV